MIPSTSSTPFASNDAKLRQRHSKKTNFYTLTFASALQLFQSISDRVWSPLPKYARYALLATVVSLVI